LNGIVEKYYRLSVQKLDIRHVEMEWFALAQSTYESHMRCQLCGVIDFAPAIYEAVVEKVGGVLARKAVDRSVIDSVIFCDPRCKMPRSPDASWKMGKQFLIAANPGLRLAPTCG
jgi:hypothetical protein